MFIECEEGADNDPIIYERDTEAVFYVAEEFGSLA